MGIFQVKVPKKNTFIDEDCIKLLREKKLKRILW